MIFYSHINEDPTPEYTSILQSESDTLYCIAGSGERLIALLDCPSLRRVMIVDSNIEALQLTELKLIALKELPVEDYLGFMGHYDIEHETRLEMYHSIRDLLDNTSSQYWDNNLSKVASGAISCGHFEQFLKRLRPLVRFLIGKKFDRLLTKNTPPPNQSYLIWNMMKFLFRQRIPYLLLGMRDKAFINTDAVIEKIPDAIQRSLDERSLHRSFMAHLIFKGHLRDMNTDLPRSVEPEVLLRIKDRLQSNELKLSWIHSDVLQTLPNDLTPASDRVFLSLSDILSFISVSQLIDWLTKLSGPHQTTTVVVRSFLRNSLRDHMTPIRDHFGNVRDLSALDPTNMYEVFKMELE